MKPKLRGVFVVDPAFDVPVLVLPYRQPRDAGWTRQTFASGVLKPKPMHRIRQHGPLRVTGPVSKRDRVEARWRDVISTGQ